MRFAAALERLGVGWEFETRQSTRRALRCRRGEREILIVNHDGRGWWDPLSQAKGDVFDLVQPLDLGLDLGNVRGILRCMVGVAPSHPAASHEGKGRGVTRPIPERWSRQPRLRRGSAAWSYLTGTRALAAASSSVTTPPRTPFVKVPAAAPGLRTGTPAGQPC